MYLYDELDCSPILLQRSGGLPLYCVVMKRLGISAIVSSVCFFKLLLYAKPVHNTLGPSNLHFRETKQSKCEIALKTQVSDISQISPFFWPEFEVVGDLAQPGKGYSPELFSI
jgi:hypothetical protein